MTPGFDEDSPEALRRHVAQLAERYAPWFADPESMLDNDGAIEIVENIHLAAAALERDEIGLCRDHLETVGYLQGILEARGSARAEERERTTLRSYETRAKGRPPR